SIICVVSNVKEVFSIEKMNQYNGLYHVLGGVISTQKGILPDQLNIQDLLRRVENGVEEVIIGLNATVEGEMTALYLAKKLEFKCKITRLAFGLPIGGHLDYADDMTLLKAFEGRNEIE
ncbi:MAG: recombination protein RecR, partial [Erysipelothrix sp.]|nr:recombination protein RecR [Erysipelothrix sp.]